MVSFSKAEFDRVVTPAVTCQQIFHPATDQCLRASVELLVDCIYGSTKFLLPLWLAKLVYNRRKLNGKSFKRQLISYARTVMFFSLYATSILTTNCLIRSSTERFHYYTIGLICGTISGLNIFVESKEMRMGKCLLFTNLAIENVIKYCESKKIFRRRPLIETLVFAALTANLMYLFASTNGAHKMDMLWFFAPEALPKNPPSCQHDCYKTTFDSFAKYFLIGYTMELVNNLLRNWKSITKETNQRFAIECLRLLLLSGNVRFGLFFGGFVGIFKGLMCYFRRSTRRDAGRNDDLTRYASIAGFAAGLAYYLKPNVSFNVMAFTTVVQVMIFKLWHRCELNAKSKFARVPFVELWTAFICGLIIHQRFLHEDMCVSYVIKALDLLSNNRMSQARSNFVAEALKGLHGVKRF